MNETIKKQLNHTTIREFLDKSIPEDVFNTLMAVAQRTATSVGMQWASIIRVKDEDIKIAISQVCKQEYVARAPELLIFVADCYRSDQIAKEKGYESDSSNDIDKFFQAFTDSCLMAQNVVNAVESLDLGCVYLGSIHNDIKKICEILNLPPRTFPVVGLGIGYPNQSPQLKPRMKMEARVYENSYDAKKDYLNEFINEYDLELQEYYDLREANKRVDSFSNQVLKNLKNPNENRQDILNVIAQQGFDLKIKK